LKRCGNSTGLIPQAAAVAATYLQVLRVPLDAFRRIMLSGEMLLPSITTAYLALDKLQEQGLL
jgi:hypothetical protein